LNEPDLNERRIDQFATEEEVRAAISSEAQTPTPRIAAGARWILRRHVRLASEMTALDLIYSAYEAILTTRNWNKSKADFTTHVFGVMRSIASNETRKLASTKPQVSYGQEERDDDDSESITIAQEISTPEEMLLKLENAFEVEERIQLLRDQLSHDSESLAILNMLLENGLSKAEIRMKLNMTTLQFWAADRRLQRAILKLGGN